MRKLAVLFALALLLAPAVHSLAITWGEPDGDGYPYVGLVVFDDAAGPAWRCSGTLIAPTVFLTAGHCTDGAVTARVWFESEITDSNYPFGGGTSVAGTPVTHPDFSTGFPNTRDVGVVILSTPVNDKGFGQLPTLHILDDLATRRGQQDTSFTPVGYGLQSVVPDLQADRVRYYATSNLVNLRSALTDGYNLHTSNNAGKGNGRGGTCFGDSGGPVFLNNTNIIAAVTSFGLNPNCVGADFAYRVDIEDARAFLDDYVAVP